MRKLTAFLLLLSVFLLAVIPAHAQEDTGVVTIAEIVTDAATGEDAEFTVLLRALQSADSVFLDMLSDPESRVTVFAPTDTAFEELIEALGTTPASLLADRALLNDILSYHVVPAYYPAETISAMDGAFIGTILRGEALRITISEDEVFVNASRVLDTNLFASNGIVHVIDTVLVTPPPFNVRASGNIAEIIAANAASTDTPEFTILQAALQIADPSILATLNSSVPYTFFAPTDVAFTLYLENAGLTAGELLADIDTLNAVLSYHIVPGEITLDDLVNLGRSMRPGEEPRLTTLIPGVTVDMVLSQNRIAINDTTVLLPNLQASNGVIHVIDGVLVPPF